MRQLLVQKRNSKLYTNTAARYIMADAIFCSHAYHSPSAHHMSTQSKPTSTSYLSNKGARQIRDVQKMRSGKKTQLFVHLGSKAYMNTKDASVHRFALAVVCLQHVCVCIPLPSRKHLRGFTWRCIRSDGVWKINTVALSQISALFKTPRAMALTALMGSKAAWALFICWIELEIPLLH